MLHAMKTGKIQSKEAGFRSGGFKHNLWKNILGHKVDISIIKEGGLFDNGKMIPLAPSEAAWLRVARYSHALKGAGLLFMIPEAAEDGYDIYTAYEEDKKIGNYTRTERTVTNVAGDWSGAIVGGEAGSEIGAEIGLAGGPIGSVIGGFIGAVFGGSIGYFTGREVAKDEFNNFEESKADIKIGNSLLNY